MSLFIAALIVGFLLLMWSANVFTDNALHLGQYFHVSKFIIGIVVLGFGTSTPELLVSGLSALQGNPGLAIGNALGSNTTNILLILGTTLCLLPLYVDTMILRRNFLLLLGATVLFAILIADGQLHQLDGLLLLIALVFILYLLTRFELKERRREDVAQEPAAKSLAGIVVGLTIGLVILLLSSKLVVWSAIAIAELLGFSDLIIGLTVVALGTSLPELATCISSALKKHGELALSNIIGSNIFNTLGVTGIASLVTVYSVPREIYVRDIPAMLIATVGLFVLAWLFLRAKEIPRGFGVCFVIAYVIYIYIIYRQLL